MKKRKHVNSKRRITAKERATACVDLFWTRLDLRKHSEVRDIIQRALAAHARAALRRDDRRDRR